MSERVCFYCITILYYTVGLYSTNKVKQVVFGFIPLPGLGLHNIYIWSSGIYIFITCFFFNECIFYSIYIVCSIYTCTVVYCMLPVCLIYVYAPIIFKNMYLQSYLHVLNVLLNDCYENFND